ncbi:cupin domain-containing protein [Fredinandcohnia sp. 179-A 10B2 NHS]|uniref:cupin domain-containing protein n=1 Tax=Fredinandcohnia sp. 179-A 10B2 NHS TaxID=3235176 RepID=UPI0039A22EA3
MKKETLDSFIEYNEDRFTKRIVYKEGESTVFVLNFMPNQALPAHKHPGTNVYLLVLDGEGTFTIDQEVSKVKKNDVILCNGEEELSFVNDGDQNVSLYVMLNKIPDERFVQNI